MSIIHYVHLYMLSLHLHTIRKGGLSAMPMLNRGGGKIWAKEKKGVATTHNAGKWSDHKCKHVDY
jgi:hypothetical protein